VFRRAFTEEFKAGAVQLVLDEGKIVGRAAGDLDLAETAAASGIDACDPRSPVARLGAVGV
jgi:transposase-like protein